MPQMESACMDHYNAYVALYIWNKTDNLHGCASSWRGGERMGAAWCFYSPPTKALSSCLLGRPLSCWSAAAHPSSGESSKFEPDVIVRGSLLAFPLDSSGDKSMKSLRITWQLLRIIPLFDREEKRYTEDREIVNLKGREKELLCDHDETSSYYYQYTLSKSGYYPFK